ncbi:unnamed protein product [Effrenium voratum]|nr:unnamed protein product [Effrenium voratum]
MKSCPFFNKKGNLVKSCRWFSIFDSLADYLPYWFVLSVQLVHLCLRKHIVRSMEELHMCMAQNIATARAAAAASEGHAVASEGAASRMMKHGAAEQLSFLKKMTGNLHVATCVSMSRFNKRLATVLLHAVAPVRESHGIAQKQFSTRRGGMERQVQMAAGQWVQEVVSIAKTTVDHKKLESMGFRASPYEATGDVLEEDEGQQLAEFALRFIANLLGQRLLKYQMYSHGMPFKLAWLLHHEEVEQKTALQTLREWWRTLSAAEVAAHTNPCVASLLAELCWPAQQWYRCLLLELDEVAFSHCPEHLRRQVYEWATGLQTTTVTEYGFHHLRTKESATETGKLGRQRRWLSLLDSGILADHDRPPLQKLPEDSLGVTHGKSIKRQVFEAEGGSPSFQAADLDSLTQEDSWRSPSSDAFSKSPLAWMALLKLFPGKTTALQTLWLSVLAVPLTLLQKRPAKPEDEIESSCGGLVLMSTEFGVLLWKLQWARCADGKRLYFLCSEPDACWQLAVVHNLAEWAAAAIQVVSPAECCRLGQQSLKIGFRKVGHSSPLLNLAAAHGFPGVTGPVLSKLISHLGMRFSAKNNNPRPTTVEGMVRALATHVLGADVDLEAVLSHRGGPQQVDTVLCRENLAAVQELLEDEDDKQAASKVVEQMENNEAARRAALGKRPVPSQQSRKPLPAPATPAGWSAEQLSKLCPPAKVTISLETKWHARWRCSYPCAPPNNTSRVFDAKEDRSQREAQLYCLRFLWQCHARATGATDCPWALHT